ncbi:MAG: helicase, partial [Burkholderiales bacterium]|nr:helicase [Burkholderiales bacterium]
MPVTQKPSAAPTPPLPNPRHLKRLPPGLGAEAVERLRQAGYALPQVVTPADYLPENSPGFESHLDKLGLVQLGKPAPGGRPSRWIEPRLVEAALAHLDAVGSGSGTRALMLERTAALEALGIERRAGAFTRRVVTPIEVPVPDGAPWAVSLPWRTPQDEAPVWAFHRSGERADLLAALGPDPAHPRGAEIRGHLAALIERSHAYQPRQLESLFARLAAECATGQGTDELIAACSRAQDRWERRVDEIEALQGLQGELAFQGYPDTFQKARQLQRSVTLFVGPPNSGKTHAAFERLAQALDGAYLA